MRFRPKFGLIRWCWVALACGGFVFSVFGQARPAGSFHGFSATVMAILALQHIVFYLFTYWEVDSGFLRVRHVWSTKQIAWDEITRVGGRNGRPSANCLEVDYARAAPLSDRGRLLTHPEDRRGFIEALRRYAAHATFEV